MTASNREPEEPLNDIAYWRRWGGELGRVNQPKSPGGDVPIREALRAAWNTDLRKERVAFIDTLDALDSRRGNIKRRLHEIHAQAASDPRQASALPITMEKDLDLTRQRTTLHNQFIQVIDVITQRAWECDAAWRLENERQRDRRLSIEATELNLPPDILDLPPDPYA
jgi:hypothetical protein